MRPLVKVCGLTRAEDAAFAAAQGADLLGFVCHPPSPRHCSELSLAAPFGSRSVLVMVADTAAAILDQAHRHGFVRVQPHLPPAQRTRGVAELREAGLFVLLPWADEAGQPPVGANLYLWEPSPAQTGLPGGAGLGHAMAFPPPGEFLLAGGLAAETLADRLAALPEAARPHYRGADAASLLEARPGVKDPARVAAFIRTTHALGLP